MDRRVDNNIVRVVRTEFPTNINTIAVDFLSLLEAHLELLLSKQQILYSQSLIGN